MKASTMGGSSMDTCRENQVDFSQAEQACVETCAGETRRAVVQLPAAPLPRRAPEARAGPHMTAWGAACGPRECRDQANTTHSQATAALPASAYVEVGALVVAHVYAAPHPVKGRVQQPGVDHPLLQSGV